MVVLLSERKSLIAHPELDRSPHRPGEPDGLGNGQTLRSLSRCNKAQVCNKPVISDTYQQ